MGLTIINTLSVILRHLKNNLRGESVMAYPRSISVMARNLVRGSPFW